MNYYKIELYNHVYHFSVFITITAYGEQSARENAEYFLKQMCKSPNLWMVNNIIEVKDF